jgi:hypothetical protein
MSQRATGSFDVKVTPQKPDTQIARAANFSRLTIDKRFHGDLEGISKGEMLALQTEVKGSAGYVALERVTGTLKGRSRGQQIVVDRLSPMIDQNGLISDHHNVVFEYILAVREPNVRV